VKCKVWLCILLERSRLRATPHSMLNDAILHVDSCQTRVDRQAFRGTRLDRASEQYLPMSEREACALERVPHTAENDFFFKGSSRSNEREVTGEAINRC